MSTSPPGAHDPVVVASATLRFPTRPPALTPYAPETVVPDPVAQDTSVDLSSLAAEEHDPLMELRASSCHSSGRRIAEERLSAENSPAYYSIQLPSGFFFYPFKSLSACLVTGRHQMKFSRSAKEGNLRYTVEAVTSCLGDGVNSADLCVPDFYYVLYWLRTASYTKYDFTHLSVCTNPEHVARVKSEELPVSTLKTVHILKSTQIEEDPFDPQSIFTMDLSATKAAGLVLGYHAMRDAVEFNEKFDVDAPDFADAMWSVDLACTLHPKHHGTLAERMELVASLPADVIRELDAYANVSATYGVREFVNVRCKECGAEQRSQLSVSAHSFL